MFAMQAGDLNTVTTLKLGCHVCAVRYSCEIHGRSAGNAASAGVGNKWACRSRSLLRARALGLSETDGNAGTCE